MIQDAPVAGTPLSVELLARLARDFANIRYFKIEVPGAAAKLRSLIEAGGKDIEGPWDGEEAITLLADLDAGATGAMTRRRLSRRHPPDHRSLFRRQARGGKGRL